MFGLNCACCNMTNELTGCCKERANQAGVPVTIAWTLNWHLVSTGDDASFGAGYAEDDDWGNCNNSGSVAAKISFLYQTGPGAQYPRWVFEIDDPFFVLPENQPAPTLCTVTGYPAYFTGPPDTTLAISQLDVLCVRDFTIDPPFMASYFNVSGNNAASLVGAGGSKFKSFPNIGGLTLLSCNPFHAIGSAENSHGSWTIEVTE